MKKKLIFFSDQDHDENDEDENDVRAAQVHGNAGARRGAERLNHFIK